MGSVATVATIIGTMMAAGFGWEFGRIIARWTLDGRERRDG